MSKTVKVFLLILAGFAIVIFGPIILLVNEVVIPLGLIGLLGGFNDDFATSSADDYSEVMEYYYYGSLAPNSLDGLSVTRFEFEYESKFLSASLEFLLEVKYGTADEYSAEVERLRSKIGGAGIDGAIMGESKYFTLPAYVAQWNDFGTFEYALCDDASMTVYYIELDASGELGRIIDEGLLPKGLSEIVENTDDPEPYSIYSEFDRWDDEIEQGKDDYNKACIPVFPEKKLAFGNFYLQKRILIHGGQYES